MEIFISVLALFATFWNLHLQRVHNAKSLKPLGQIDLVDSKKKIYIFIQNSGVGPLIIDKLIFTKNGKQYSSISECLNLDPKSYYHMLINDAVKKVVSPNSHFIVFEKNIEHDTDIVIEEIRKQLSSISVMVNCLDIYDNKSSFERNLDWFSRHMIDKVN
ncbi:hypothetical protein [Emticicia sp. 17c]|uniref:hypothetical protein n=1 Tax=Emticicia sp. 17c TaxID=3127704 RepID=UPI00301C4075